MMEQPDAKIVIAARLVSRKNFTFISSILDYSNHLVKGENNI
ncbi:hypothetical protein KKH3_22670 [Pectobacterium actinidiae]|nr:hypothetical protein KKH3_22670 [Pectobacterium actinidiae]